ncbi:MAG: nitrophenyl compound nitroreductase subunit ArsF family protein [Planctomycetota bacterium]
MIDATADQLRRYLAPPLIVFMLISIGFALGRLTAPREMGAGASASATEEAQVVVSYLHGSLRCVTCNSIEQQLRTLVHERYAEALQDGRLHFREVDYERNEALAERYGITGSTAVVSWRADGREAGFERLDAVWTHLNDPAAFKAYVAGHIDARLAALEAQGDQA